MDIKFPFRKQQQKPRDTSGNCKIRIKKTKTGEEIEFSPSCGKEEIQLAKERFLNRENPAD